MNTTPVARGIRNNNPGNIRANAEFGWLGQTGVDPEGFVIFSSPTLGIRALLITFHNYQVHHGLKTPVELINRWAPPSENDVSHYIGDVCARLGVSVFTPIDIQREAIPWASAIVLHECGTNPYSMDVYDAAKSLAFNSR